MKYNKFKASWFDSLATWIAPNFSSYFTRWISAFAKVEATFPRINPKSNFPKIITQLAKARNMGMNLGENLSAWLCEILPHIENFRVNCKTVSKDSVIKLYLYQNLNLYQTSSFSTFTLTHFNQVVAMNISVPCWRHRCYSPIHRCTIASQWGRDLQFCNDNIEQT